MSKYKTIKGESKAEYKEKGSRFLAYAAEINQESDAIDYIKKIATNHHKARHVCYAYIIGNQPQTVRYSDANEPANTAGLPILNHIKKAGLINIIIVVVRYFGGVLLGKGGLIRAYGSVAEEAILNAKIIEKDELFCLELELSYIDFVHVMDVIKKYNILILKQEFADICKIKLQVQLDDKAAIISNLEKFSQLKISIFE